MRKCKVFVGTSHPEFGKLVCEKLGMEPAPCTLKKFANGETLVQIGVLVRDEDVYIIQSGLPTVNDHIMELLILISACRGGSASKVTAVIPQLPYLKQSKMKKHRGAITLRMLANLLVMAGADHVVLMDLHALQMQGFFTKPVDNLYGASKLAQWIRKNVDDYENAVVVSKNPGGTKRVTALADALKINFAMIHTDRRRREDGYSPLQQFAQREKARAAKSPAARLLLVSRLDSVNNDGLEEEEEEDNIVLDVLTGRIIKGHVVRDDEGLESGLPLVVAPPTPATSDQLPHDDDDILDDDEDEQEFQSHEKLITLVGDVLGRLAIILDDLIDKAGLFVAAAEHLRLNCGAKKVYLAATHGIFSDECLDSLQACPYIDQVIVTNTYPITAAQKQRLPKLVVIDVSKIFAECIRRDHYGESVSVLFDLLLEM